MPDSPLRGHGIFALLGIELTFKKSFKIKNLHFKIGFKELVNLAVIRFIFPLYFLLVVNIFSKISCFLYTYF